MDQQRPGVSVVVSTFRRADRIPRLLEALERQTLAPDSFEVVVVDDASPDGTSIELARFATGSPLDLHILRRGVNGGPAAGRNTGWRAARAPVIAFTDDDCVPHEAWLREGLRAIQTGADVVSGRTVPDPRQADHLADPWARTIQVDEARFFQCCNVFYRRDRLVDVDGFDEELRTGEDTELAYRAAGRGARTAFAESAVVYHEVRGGRFSDALRDATRWADLPGVVARHPEARRLLHRGLFWKRTHPPAIVAGLGLLGATRRLPALLLIVPWIVHRVSREPLCPGPRRRWAVLPQGLVVDLLEVVTMFRGSLRHRTLVL